MKGILKTGIVILIIGLTATLTIGIYGKTLKKKMANERIKSLPVFSFKTLDDNIFRSDQLRREPVLILFFHPECEHCKYQITNLLKSELMFQGLQIILVSDAEKEAVKSFVKDYGLLKYTGLIILVDNTYSFKEYFGTDVVPSLFIYNKEHKLVRFFQGEVRQETVLKYLRQDD
jgi:thiol-disulfide isomerase/thioredoxin